MVASIFLGDTGSVQACGEDDAVRPFSVEREEIEASNANAILVIGDDICSGSCTEGNDFGSSAAVCDAVTEGEVEEGRWALLSSDAPSESGARVGIGCEMCCPPKIYGEILRSVCNSSDWHCASSSAVDDEEGCTDAFGSIG